jgi:hypothetical protein
MSEKLEAHRCFYGLCDENREGVGRSRRRKRKGTWEARKTRETEGILTFDRERRRRQKEEERRASRKEEESVTITLLSSSYDPSSRSQTKGALQASKEEDQGGGTEAMMTRSAPPTITKTDPKDQETLLASKSPSKRTTPSPFSSPVRGVSKRQRRSSSYSSEKVTAEIQEEGGRREKGEEGGEEGESLLLKSLPILRDKAGSMSLRESPSRHRRASLSLVTLSKGETGGKDALSMTLREAKKDRRSSMSVKELSREMKGSMSYKEGGPSGKERSASMSIKETSSKGSLTSREGSLRDIQGVKIHRSHGKSVSKEGREEKRNHEEGVSPGVARRNSSAQKPKCTFCFSVSSPLSPLLSPLPSPLSPIPSPLSPLPSPLSPLPSPLSLLPSPPLFHPFLTLLSQTKQPQLLPKRRELSEVHQLLLLGEGRLPSPENKRRLPGKNSDLLPQRLLESCLLPRATQVYVPEVLFFLLPHPPDTQPSAADLPFVFTEVVQPFLSFLLGDLRSQPSVLPSALWRRLEPEVQV